MRAPASESSELKQTDLPRRFFTLSNVLSLTRLFLALPFAIVMKDGAAEGRLWGGAIMILAAVTDKLDGYAARKLGQTSEWGRILDPLADKVAVATVLVVLFILGDLPAWFLILGLVRDLIILVGGLYLRKKTRILVPSNELGKWTVGVISAMMFILVLSGSGLVTDFLMVGSTVMMILSLGIYWRRFLLLLKENKA